VYRTHLSTLIVDCQPPSSSARCVQNAATRKSTSARVSPDRSLHHLSKDRVAGHQPLNDGEDALRHAEDLAPIGMVAESQHVLVVKNNLPANNVKELIALAKSKPGNLSCGSAGGGSTFPMAATLFKTQAARHHRAHPVSRQPTGAYRHHRRSGPHAVSRAAGGAGSWAGPQTACAGRDRIEACAASDSQPAKVKALCALL
jgi:hypothetical protein